MATVRGETTGSLSDVFNDLLVLGVQLREATNPGSVESLRTRLSRELGELAPKLEIGRAHV